MLSSPFTVVADLSPLQWSPSGAGTGHFDRIDELFPSVDESNSIFVKSAFTPPGARTDHFQLPPPPPEARELNNIRFRIRAGWASAFPPSPHAINLQFYHTGGASLIDAFTIDLTTKVGGGFNEAPPAHTYPTTGHHALIAFTLGAPAMNDISVRIISADHIGSPWEITELWAVEFVYDFTPPPPIRDKHCITGEHGVQQPAPGTFSTRQSLRGTVGRRPCN